MSGFVRTLQKRIFRNKFGMARQTSRVIVNPTTKQPEIKTYPKGKGPIVDGLGEIIGAHYPRLLPTPAAIDG